VLISLPTLLPVLWVVAVLIRLDSAGPVLFFQRRVGKSGRPFNMVKFRSMCHRADADGAKFTSAADQRTTRLGRFIRKTRIDELPQFWNVLIGDMSLIGPRPEQVPFVARFAKEIPFYEYRHMIKPGITGWAQVTQGYAGSVDETRIKLAHDLYYIRHYSIFMDLLIVLKTICTMLTGFGAK
jgi:lipopolysaccharide/colanic/teichoic acid biosynthesis glycosyltransferase